MKRAWVLYTLAVLLAFLMAVPALGQTTSKINVTSTEVNAGVVMVTIQKAAKEFELQCNQGMNGCKALTKGVYTMIELPENHGMYICRDVEVYPETTAQEPAKDAKLGEYSLEKK